MFPPNQMPPLLGQDLSTWHTLLASQNMPIMACAIEWSILTNNKIQADAVIVSVTPNTHDLEVLCTARRQRLIQMCLWLSSLYLSIYAGGWQGSKRFLPGAGATMARTASLMSRAWPRLSQPDECDLSQSAKRCARVAMYYTIRPTW